MNGKRTICVILVDRANYGRLKPVMREIQAHPALTLQCIAAGTMVLERFGRPAEIVRSDGFPVNAEVFMELEGSTPASMAKSVGFGVVEFASELQRLRPDLVLLIGDRYEALAAAVACAYMNLCLVHIQGGEISGSIDESARHAISRFAQFHFPSTERARQYLVRMGEDPQTILGVGCPGSDIARTMDRRLDPRAVNGTGSGAILDLTRQFLLVIYHPTTTAYGGEAQQMRQLLEALRLLARPAILLWPNIDAGADHISKEIRIFREQHGQGWLRTITNLEPENYLRVLAATACAVGNSSSFVRDAGYFGTPVVLVGERQDGRETDTHVIRCATRAADILDCVEAQWRHGHYPPSKLYGDGFVARRVAEQLALLTPYVQKRLHYVTEEPQTWVVNGYARPCGDYGTRGLQGDPAQEPGYVAR